MGNGKVVEGWVEGGWLEYRKVGEGWVERDDTEGDGWGRRERLAGNFSY